MKKTYKLFVALVLCVAMVFSVGSLAVSGDTTYLFELTVGETTTQYATLSEAVEAAPTDGPCTIKLLDTVENISSVVTIDADKEIILDGDGNLIMAEVTNLITNLGTLTIKNLEIMNFTADTCLLASGGTCVIENSKLSGSSCIVVEDGATVTIKSGLFGDSNLDESLLDTYSEKSANDDTSTSWNFPVKVVAKTLITEVPLALQTNAYGGQEVEISYVGGETLDYLHATEAPEAFLNFYMVTATCTLTHVFYFDLSGETPVPFEGTYAYDDDWSCLFVITPKTGYMFGSDLTFTGNVNSKIVSTEIQEDGTLYVYYTDHIDYYVDLIVGETTTHYGFVGEALEAAPSGTPCTIKLVDDSEMYSAVTIAADKEIVLDGDGHIISAEKNNLFTNLGTLTIKNVEIRNYRDTCLLASGGTCVIENSKLVGSNAIVVEDGATVVIKSGLFGMADIDDALLDSNSVKYANPDSETNWNLHTKVAVKAAPVVEEGKEPETIEVPAGSEETISFHSNADIADFKELVIDGQVVPTTDYTVTEGSTIITLKAKYVKTLSQGNHTLGIVSYSGTATFNFAITEPVPKTGIGNQVALWAIVALMSGMVVLLVSKKRGYVNK